jgi:hypothetical protein
MPNKNFKIKKRFGKKAILFLLLTSILLIGMMLMHLFTSLSKEPLTNLYSNGWYDFTFRYPEKADLFIVQPIPTNGYSIAIGKSVGKNTCQFDLYSRNDNYADQLNNSSYPSSVTFGNVLWEKERFKDNSLFYGFDSFIWTTRTNAYQAKMIAYDKSDERYCENILSSVSFKADKSVLSAREAIKVKEAALNYANEVYPDKKFMEGKFFINDHDALGISKNAYVKLSNSYSSVYPEPKYLNLESEDGVWQVKSVSDDPYGYRD